MRKSWFKDAFCTWLVMVLLATSSAFSQRNDSLWSVWRNPLQSPQERLEAINQLIWQEYLYSQPESAFHYGSLQYALAEEVQDSLAILHAIQVQGLSFYLRGEYAEALTYLEQGLVMSENLGNLKNTSEFLNNIGAVYQDQGKFKEALTYFERDQKIGEELGDKQSLAVTYQNMGRLYRNLGNLDTAMTLYQKGEQLAQETNDQQTLSRIWNGMANILKWEGKEQQAIAYYEKSLAVFQELQNQRGIAGLTFNIGLIFLNQGNYQQAIEYVSRSLAASENMGSQPGIGRALNALGVMYMRQEDDSLALSYYERALELFEKMGDQAMIANMLGNIGEIYLKQEAFDKALEFQRQSLVLREAIGDPSEIGVCLSDIGLIYLEQEQFSEALPYFQQSLKRFEAAGDKTRLAAVLSSLGITEHHLQGYPSAIRYGRQALAYARETQNLLEISDAANHLFLSYKATGQAKQALEMHELYISSRDSLKSEENQRAIIQREYQYTYEKQALADSLTFAKEQEVKDAIIQREQTRRNALGIGLLLFVILSGGIFWQFLQTRKARKIAEREHARSEELLLNILPAETAQELKEKGYTTAQRFENVTVLFSDIKGFTTVAASMSPEELVGEIDTYFRTFDKIMEANGLEKIKTIGDAYIAVGGLPSRNHANAVLVLQAAIEMQQAVTALAAERRLAGKPFFELRIGLHTGPLVAGVVGIKKFQYDIWGDTVNVAARMEQSSEAGRINLSAVTYKLVKDHPEVSFEARGSIPVKNKGEMEMYFVAE